MDGVQIKIKALEEQITLDQAKITVLERSNRALIEKLGAAELKIDELEKKTIDEGRRADVLKVENMRQKDIMMEMARERNQAPSMKRKWHEFWKGQK